MLELDIEVRYYEVGEDETVPMHMFCNYFQEVAGVDAHNLSFGREELSADSIVWILTRMQMEMTGEVRAREKLKLVTWHAFTDKLTSRREFYIQNAKGEIVFKCASWWLHMNLKTRKISRMPASLIAINPANPNYTVEEKDFFKAPAVLKDAQRFAQKTITVRAEDIDNNGHVNNIHFTAWAAESAPKEFRARHKLKELFITFKAECFEDDKLDISVYKDKENSFWHILKRESDGKDVVHAYTVWEEK